MPQHTTIRSARSGLTLLFACSLACGLLVAQPARSLATFPGEDGRIAFQGLDTSLGRLELFTARPDGTHRRQLTHLADADIELPTWSPDGSTIAFDSDEAGGIHIFTVGANGDGLTQITTGDGAEYSPTWAPDSQTMIFEHVEDGSADGLFLYDVESQMTTRLTANPFGQFDTRPRYSPDGTQVSFTRVKAFLPDGGALSAVFVINTDGGGLRRLTSFDENAGENDWSPDGTTIVFNDADDRIQEAEIFAIRPDGTGRRQLTHSRDAGSFRPCWSPSGRKIIFTRVRFGPSGGGPFRFFTMDARGRHLRRVHSSTPLQNQADWQRAPESVS